MISLEAVSKRYGDRLAVDDLSFTVEPGRVTGFLGPNGSGKSTTMRLVLGLDAPTTGRALVDGRPYARHDAPLRTVGALLEARGVHPGRSAVAHLRALAATHGIPRARVTEVLELVGLASVATRRAGGFSLGIDDVKNGRLNIDRLQDEQAKTELGRAEGNIPKLARECFKWLLCPVMASSTDRQPSVEAFALPTSGGAFAGELERICQDNELVISAWAPIHLRNKLRELYWKDTTVAVRAAAVWEDMQRYLYMPRMKRRAVLEQAILKGCESRDFFGTAYGQRGDQFEGFKLGDANVQFDDALLLLEPVAAAAYEAAQRKPELVSKEAEVRREQGGQRGDSGPAVGGGVAPERAVGVPEHGAPGVPPAALGQKAKAFFGSVDVSATTAKMKLVSIAEEIIAVLAADPNASVKVTVEIVAEFPTGASDQTKRAVSENAAELGFKSKSWE